MVEASNVQVKKCVRIDGVWVYRIGENGIRPTERFIEKQFSRLTNVPNVLT